MTGIQDRGRSLLSFEFQEAYESMRGDIFTRSVSELIISNESNDESKVEKLIENSIKIETLQQKKSCQYMTMNIPKKLTDIVKAKVTFDSVEKLTAEVAKEIKEAEIEEFSRSCRNIKWIKESLLDKLESVLFRGVKCDDLFM